MTYPAAWHRRRYPRDVTYVLTHASWPGGQEILAETEATEATFHSVRHDPLHPSYGRTRSEFTLLGRVTVSAQTTWPDAISQVSAHLPGPYRHLPLTLTLLGPSGERYWQTPRPSPPPPAAPAE